MSLVTDDPASGRITLPVHLWVKADLYANPDTVDFGTVNREDARRGNTADTVLTQTLLLRKRTGKFQIKSIVGDSPVLVATHSPSGPSERFAIDFAVAAGGPNPWNDRGEAPGYHERSRNPGDCDSGHGHGALIQR